MILSTIFTDFISFCVGWFATWRYPRWLIRRTIDWYVERFKLKMDEASQSLNEYQTLGQLFIRDLRSEVRPIKAVACSPVDGLLRECGLISDGVVFKVKNQLTDLSDLLQDKDHAERFKNGTYWNFYLSPQDCHHVFSPIDGEVVEVKRIPGALFPVNDFAVKWLSRLFLRNARLITYLRTPKGWVAIVMVGALNVGKMQSYFETENLKVGVGERIGTFHLGSSVVLLTEWACSPLDVTPKRVLYGGKLMGLD